MQTDARFTVESIIILSEDEQRRLDEATRKVLSDEALQESDRDIFRRHRDAMLEVSSKVTDIEKTEHLRWAEIEGWMPPKAWKGSTP